MSTRSGSGSGGTPGPGAQSSDTLVLRLNLRNRTYSVEVGGRGTFPVRTQWLDCASGAVTREEVQQMYPLRARALGVRRLPPDFARTHRVTGTGSVSSCCSTAFDRYTATWDLTLDEPGYDVVPPQTIVRRTPRARTTSGSATFTFGANERGSTFECRLDGARWVRCASPKTYRGLARRAHVFQVRATDVTGNRDQTPARYAWRVTRP
jgi:hypothetical protein